MEEKKKQVVITRTFPAGIERMWRAFTEKEEMLKWYSPVNMTTPTVDVDLRIGGKYAITMEYDETGEQVTVRGEFKIIEKPTKLVYTWKWDGSDMEVTEVTIMFHESTKDETMVTLIHSGFSLHPTENDIKNNWTHETHKGGWTTAFEKLEKLIR